jgi:phosphatidylinositol alpha-1,6-mannosyltransferase
VTSPGAARHLLVTNDFPPKTGGIQSYLWELWRRLPPADTTVLTTPHPGAGAWDRQQPYRIERTRQRVLLPTPGLRRRIDRLAAEVDAPIVLLDPALPLGLLGPSLERPYGLVIHGAEVTVPGRLPGGRALLARVLRDARLVVAAGGYPAAEAERAAGCALPTVVVPPGVDVDRFHPLDASERAAARAHFGLDPDAMVVLGLSRLVPRKGFDVLLRAAADLRRSHPDLQVVIAGAGRDRARLERIAARSGAPARFVGRVSDDDLPRLHGCVDVFAMLCRNRWLGLEQEGFGIVFLEAAAAGVPQLAGASGGSHEAVVDGVTGSVVGRPRSVAETGRVLATLLDHPERRHRLGAAGRDRVECELTYDVLAGRLAEAIATV